MATCKEEEHGSRGSFTPIERRGDWSLTDTGASDHIFGGGAIFREHHLLMQKEKLKALEEWSLCERGPHHSSASDGSIA